MVFSKSIGIVFFLMVVMFIGPVNAFAYVGPGAGLTFIGALVGMVVAIVLAIGAILFWPVRFLIKKIKKKQLQKQDKTL